MAALVALACSTPPPTVPDGEAAGTGTGAEPGASRPASAFSQERAWNDLMALAAIGPRRAGSDRAAEARAYLVEQLEAMGATVERQPESFHLGGKGAGADDVIQVEHVKGVLPGASEGVVILAAHFDSLGDGPGANNGASGPAVVLELGRALAGVERPYTVWLVFVEGDGLLAQGRLVLAGTRTFLRASERPRVRLAVSFGGVGDADLHIARDLRSDRSDREMFWQAARDLGEVDAFPPDARFEHVVGGHLPFLDIGIHHSVGIQDAVYGSGEIPGDLWGSASDTIEHCSADSLGKVGRVSLEAIDRIVARLVKIDRFAERPFAPAESPAGAEPADEAEGEAPTAGTSK